MTTYEDVHAGAVIVGHDSNLWGVESIDHRSGVPAVTLVRHGRRITGWPPSGTPVTVAQPADVSAEAAAAQCLMDAGLGPVNVLWERWESEA